jgi:hypothetical protein
MTSQSSPISVTLPISPAMDRVKRLLFQPFDLGKWFVIGFGAWLAHLGGGGSGSGFHLPMRGGDIHAWYERTRYYVTENLSWILPLVGFLMVFGLALWVLLIWLSSRGRFIFLHCVALDKAEVAEPWNKYAHEGNSLCRFRLVFGLIGMVLIMPLVVLAVILVVRMVNYGGFRPGSILVLVGLGLVLVTTGLIFSAIAKLTEDFVVPIMYLRGGTCRAGWGELLGLISTYLAPFILYLLFQIVLSIVLGAIVLGVVLVTCCLAGCVMAIPYVGTVALLPILMFKRAYSLYYLGQFGSKYDVIV